MLKMGLGIKLANRWTTINPFKGGAVPPERRLGKDAVTALIIHCCFQFGASMSGLFLNLYLWRLTQDLVVNGLYNIILYCITPFAFAAGGYIAKKTDRMVTYRLGIMMIALFYLMVIIAREQVVNYYIWFAICNGIASGFYWTGYLILQYDVSTDSNRIRFLAINMVAFNSAGLVGPALAGYVIQRSAGLEGYIIIFTIAFIMFVLAAVISFRIPAIISHHKAYYLKFVGIVMRKNRRWVKGLFGFLVIGLFQGIMLFLPNILLFKAVGREDWVGYLGVFFAGVTVVTGYVISKKASKENVSKYIVLSTTGVVLGAGLLLFEVKLWSVVIFMILFSICNPLIVNTLSSYYYRIMGYLPLRGQLRVESVVMREVFINVGRVISISALLIFAGNLESFLLPLILFLTAVMQYALLFLVTDSEESEPMRG
ncbi:MFS transporter [Paenibacillus sp. IITD108]